MQGVCSRGLFLLLYRGGYARKNGFGKKEMPPLLRASALTVPSMVKCLSVCRWSQRFESRRSSCSPAPQCRPAHAPLWATSLTAASPAASLPRRAARCGARPCLTTRPRATNRGCVCAGRPQACGQPGRPPRAFGEAVRRRCPAGRRAGGSPPPTETPGARLGGLSVRSLWAGGQQAAELRRASRGVEGSGGQGRRVRREQPAVHCPVPAGHPPPLS